MGMEDPEAVAAAAAAAAEEYIAKVTQSDNWAGRVVSAKATVLGWFLPRG